MVIATPAAHVGQQIRDRAGAPTRSPPIWSIGSPQQEHRDFPITRVALITYSKMTTVSGVFEASTVHVLILTQPGLRPRAWFAIAWCSSRRRNRRRKAPVDELERADFRVVVPAELGQDARRESRYGLVPLDYVSRMRLVV